MQKAELGWAREVLGHLGRRSGGQDGLFLAAGRRMMSASAGHLCIQRQVFVPRRCLRAGAVIRCHPVLAWHGAMPAGRSGTSKRAEGSEQAARKGAAQASGGSTAAALLRPPPGPKARRSSPGTSRAPAAQAVTHGRAG